MTYQWPAKNDDDVLDYTIDWTAIMEQGDTILTSVISVSPSSLTIVTQSFLGYKTTVWFSGGVVGQIYSVTGTITTSQGRTFQRIISITVNNQ